MEDSKEYNTINQALQSMKEEYRLMPNKFLLKKIELAEKKLKQIDANVGVAKTPVGNYNSFDQEKTKEANKNVFSAFCRELPSYVDAENFMKSVIKRNPKQTIINAKHFFN